MIYLVASLKVHSGKNKEFLEILQKEYLPILINKYKWKLIAAWQVQIGDLDEVIDIWGFSDINEFWSHRMTMFKDTEYMAVRERLRLLLKEETISFATPLPISPM